MTASAQLPKPVPDISDDEFLKFKEFFYRRTGISFEPTKRYFVDKRLIERIETTGTGNFRGYFTPLRFQASGEELQQLTNLMTVNETYFLREDHQFRCLVDSILPEIVRRKTSSNPIRIWCIPSSSGEEPYSIAMYLLENWTGIREWDVEIISSDIDTSILRRARAGHCSARSVQNVPAPWLQKYFKRSGDEYQPCNDIREAVEFTRVNLSEPSETLAYRHFDVIFCRNLLIYFDDISRQTAAETFYEALNPGGFICLSHSESDEPHADQYYRYLPDQVEITALPPQWIVNGQDDTDGTPEASRVSSWFRGFSEDDRAAYEQILAAQRQILLLNDRPAWHAGRLKAVAEVLANLSQADGETSARTDIQAALAEDLTTGHNTLLLAWLDACLAAHKENQSGSDLSRLPGTNDWGGAGQDEGRGGHSRSGERFRKNSGGGRGQVRPPRR